ncbi:hypothetical protein IFM89_006549 [Coptis chinensis]|uniref:FF domain-containing protein n=1 Tax=Coptis chinensis TaxID=261450 RepID=A0A835IMQ9_9MAGN|nr:hypothetical protein IFM89_006549 [Coptis chinensis]
MLILLRNELKLGFVVGLVKASAFDTNAMACNVVSTLSLQEAKDAFKALLESANVEYEWNLTANVESVVERVRDREDLFESYLAELKKKEKAKAHEEHKRNIREYKQFLQSCDFIKANSQWCKVQDRLEEDERCLRLEKLDCLEIFQVC